MNRSTDTALLVIDAQESFRQRPEEWAATANPSVLDSIALLVEHARTRGDRVIWITHSEPGSGGVFDPDRGFVRVIAELGPLDSELAVTKTSINAFTSTDLEERLRAAGIRRLVVCGIRTEQCCETTARVANDLGFDVEFVTDATTTSSIAESGSLVAVSGQDIMRRTESILSARGFAAITTAQRFTSSSS
ncbi:MULTISPECIES: cysteine hydrolase family protein [unclassified Microbacterium]|uniref:cysteine hydrolase family protein n=1 Tax=unclassified Microbacterium TaxID=2609290 RepID=UPI000EA98272|nr:MULTISPECIES: isochorismatase family protein [unclassified Microbacterium]MBT2483888.1 isochorismatase family protein [Microbacterium sp. ISL-108]RKN69437.1 isochorismatase family protein [Microbacterium sp. CGR2]